jgi:hypothetical protein
MREGLVQDADLAAAQLLMLGSGLQLAGAGTRLQPRHAGIVGHRCRRPSGELPALGAHGPLEGLQRERGVLHAGCARLLVAVEERRLLRQWAEHVQRGVLGSQREAVEAARAHAAHLLRRLWGPLLWHRQRLRLWDTRTPNFQNSKIQKSTPIAPLRQPSERICRELDGAIGSDALG